MIRKASVAVALATMVAAACSDSMSPTVGTPQRVIVATNNNPTNTQWGYLTPLDALLKELYERNNAMSRRGEADNAAASGANLNLANIFNNPGPVTVQAVRDALANFSKDINTALKSDKYNVCSAPQLLLRAAQIDSTLADVQAAGNTLQPEMLPGAPLWDCTVSPVEFLSATGSATNGVTLTFSDPWHYDNDPRTAPHDTTLVSFHVERTDANNVTVNLPDDPALTALHQTGPATIVVSDAANTTPGTYTYWVTQCDITLDNRCSVFAAGTVIVPDPNSGGGGEYACVHDNRNGLKTKDNKTKDCPKVDKIHP